MDSAGLLLFFQTKRIPTSQFTYMTVCESRLKFPADSLDTMHLLHKIDHFNGMLTRFAQISDLRSTKKLHAHLLRSNSLSPSIDIQSNLIFAYVASSKPLQNPSTIFNLMDSPTPFPFGLLLKRISGSGFHLPALEALSFMHARGFPLDSYALCSGLTSSSMVRRCGFGRQIHGCVVKSGWGSSVFVGSAMVGLYARCVFVDDAQKVFDEIPDRNSFCANTLFLGFGEAKLWNKVIDFFRKMKSVRLDYDCFAFTAVLQACAALSAADLGRQVHAHLLRCEINLKSDVFLQSALVEMYGKCGFVDEAWKVFKGERKKRDVVLWTSMFGVCGRNGQYSDVIRLYKEMLSEGIKPDGVSFLAVISACAHTGKVGLGLECFESMVNEFGLKPGPEHYGCVVDLLCKAGELEKACRVVSEMPVEKQSVQLWGALLSACKELGNVGLGRLVAERALELEPCHAGIFSLLTGLYAEFDMREEMEQLADLAGARGLKKDSGCSWIESMN